MLQIFNKMGIKKAIKRTKLSNSQLKSEILALFNTGFTGKTELFGIIRIKYTLARDRYFKMYDECYLGWGKTKEIADNEATVSAATESARKGLKSKLEKQINLQNEINQIDSQLSGEVISSYIVGNKVHESHDEAGNFNLPIQVQNDLRVKKLQYTAELNKMEGDYQPNKVELSGAIELLKFGFDDERSED